MPCLHLFITGRVQGVWFRESMRQEALRLGATGWVRNTPDGRVEAVICGEQPILEKLLKWSEKGPPMAEVASVDTASVPEEPLSGFEKRA
jgi:acylphosphatase